jgi:DNA repair protein RecN (Recombination protein N)
MLRELRVGNLALVDDLVLPFGSGLTIITGETGAGKSLIAGAMELLTGGKAARDFIRQGEDLAYVEGVFDLEDQPDSRSACA